MEKKEVDAVVREVVGMVLQRPIEPGEVVSRDSEPAWDSLKHVEIVLALEGALAFRFNEDELSGLDDIPTIVDVAERHLAA